MELERETMAGRPRQPYCPDCKRAGRNEIPKEKGGSYCQDHRKLRQIAYKDADPEDEREPEEIVLDYTRKVNADLRDELKEKDLVISLLEKSNNRLMLDADSELRRVKNNEIRKYRTMAHDMRVRLNELVPDEYCHPNDLPEDW